MLLNDKWVTEEIKGNLKNIWSQVKMEIKIYGSKSSSNSPPSGNKRNLKYRI